MRKINDFILLVFMTVLLLAAFKSTAVSAAYKTGLYEINTKSSDLNVRTCPSTENMKVGSIPKGKVVTVTCVSSNGWGKIVYGSVHGWISLQYCRYLGPGETENSAGTEYAETDVGTENSAGTETSSGANAGSESGVTYGISAANLTWVVGCNQEFSKNGGGLCTSSATGTLLRRRQAAEGKEVTYTFSDVRISLGGSGTPNSKGKYDSLQFYYTPENGWIHTDPDTGEQTVYYTVEESTAVHAKNREYIADLLDVHPEGVVIYVKYGYGGKHSILLSDYVRNSDGSLSFYAYDPANHGVRTKLENTWLMTKFKSVGGLFNGIMKIWYIKGELVVNDSAFDYPSAQVISKTVYTSKKRVNLYSEPTTSSEKKEALAKGTAVEVTHLLTNAKGTDWYITADGLYILADRVTDTVPDTANDTDTVIDPVADTYTDITADDET